jgi:hypothetical protein
MRRNRDKRENTKHRLAEGFVTRGLLVAIFRNSNLKRRRRGGGGG